MNVWALIGGLAAITALVLWVKWLWTPSRSLWPQSVLREQFLYTIPGFLFLLGGIWLSDAAESLGAPENATTLILGIPALVFLSMVPVVFLSFMGVPMPRFSLPRWIQQQDLAHTRTETIGRDHQRKRRRTVAAVKIPVGTQTIDLAAIPWILRLPAGWEVDPSGEAEGVVVARAAEPESMNFHPNLTLICAPLPEGFTRVSVEETRADQDQVEQHYREEFDDYHLLDLSIEQVGIPAEPAVYRLAMYTGEDGTPVTLAQFITRAHGRETTLSITWATADYQWIGNSQAIAAHLERK